MKIQPVFHKSLLEAAPVSIPLIHSLPVEEQGDTDYDVEDIIEAKKTKKGWTYSIEWKGYDDLENSWKPQSNLSHESLRLALY